MKASQASRRDPFPPPYLRLHNTSAGRKLQQMRKDLISQETELPRPAQSACGTSFIVSMIDSKDSHYSGSELSPVGGGGGGKKKKIE